MRLMRPDDALSKNEWEFRDEMYYVQPTQIILTGVW